MIVTNILPAEGYIRLPQIIGQPEVTVEQAYSNKTTTSEKTTHHHKRPRPGIPPIIPLSKTAWYAGIKSGKYPPPTHLGRTSVWDVRLIRAVLDGTYQPAA